MGKENDPYYSFVPLKYSCKSINGEPIYALDEIEDYVLLTFMLWDNQENKRKTCNGWKVSCGTGNFRVEGYRINEDDEPLFWKHCDAFDRVRT